MSKPIADKVKQAALDAQLRLMWTRLEQGAPKHLYSTLRRLQAGAKPAA